MFIEDWRRSSAHDGPPKDGRLGSWKEIASHLKRSVRTVQRWEEREGLPVHRHVHDKLGSVYAYPSELDAWWSGRRPARRIAPRVAVVAVLALLGLGLASAWLFPRRPAPAGPPPPLKLAVLPFENLSGDPAQEYLSDGLTEEMITELGRLHPPRLGVIARTSVMKYKHADKGVDRIGAELGVDYVLEGSLRRSASRVRITAQLIRVKDQVHLWAESYDRDLRDILSLQGEVAQSIAGQIELRLTPAEQTRLKTARPVDPEAYEAYLLGRYFCNKRTVEGLKKGIDHFQRAVAREPAYALAHVGMADSYALLAQYGFLPAREAFPQAKAAATKALEISGDFAEAHASLAFVGCHYDWDWPLAEREFKRALELDPGYAPAHQWYAEYLTAVGRHGAALEEILRAREIDPLSLVTQTNVGRLLYYGHRPDRAVRELQRAVELDPDFIWAHVFLALTYEQKGMYAEAAAEARKEIAHSKGVLAHIESVAGHRAEALKALRELQEPPLGNHNASYFIGGIYAGLGDQDQALNWLEQAYRDRVPLLIFVAVDPWFDGLRSHPRFQALMRRVGLPR